MSDTTITITPEERASWRERLTSEFSCHDAKSAAFTLRLLTALEAAEAERDKAAKYAGQCVATALDKATSAESMRTKVAEVQSKLSGAEIRTERAEAENARLRAALDWFRAREVRVFDFAAPCQCEDDFFDEDEELAPCGENADAACPRYNSRGCGHCWVEHAEREAARRAVAGEVNS